MNKKKALPEEWITLLLSNVPAGSFVPNISRQLTDILKAESEDSELSKRFRVDKQQGYSPRLEGVLDTLRLGGALNTCGPDYRHQVTQGLHNVANSCRKIFSDDEIKYLAEVASKLKHTPSY